DFIFGSSKQVNSLRKILNSYTAASSRQTIFASASIPQHNRFVHDCVQHKWTKVDSSIHSPVVDYRDCLSTRLEYAFSLLPEWLCLLNFRWIQTLVFTCVCLIFVQSDVVHVHVNPVQPMPSHLRHTYVVSISFNDHFHLKV
uniref:Uncharacterized protein n=1 Tax=Aegilops tauschii subsp. strangulata TaxID=200361 RepID=A0A453GW85_AEGTS